MTKTLLLAAVGLTALIVNPFFGCNPLEGTFHYGAPEMRAAIEGTWKLHVPGAGDATLTIAQAAGTAQHAARATLVRSANACGTRSLVRTAGACMDVSEMPLDIKLAGMTTKAPPQGVFRAFGLEFDGGRLEVTLDDLEVNADISATGKVKSASTWRGDTNGEASLVRVR